MKKFFILFTSLAIIAVNTSSVFATTPTFPSCEAQTSDGNWSSIDNGSNHIPGREEPIWGDDDVYRLENDNFLQCLCPNDSSIGIQSNWWRIGDSLSQNEIDDYKSKGWLFELGSDWNLIDDNYLVKNVEYTCRKPTPTPSPTPTPTATPTATPSPSPTSTATPKPDHHRSECVLLTANVYGGTAPLTVEFQAHGYDSDHVEEYKFDYGTEIINTKNTSSTHRFDKSGNFGVRLFIKDSRGVWKTSDKCNVNINVIDKPQVLGASDTKELPKTGISYFFIGFLVTGVTGIGLYLKLR